MSSALFEALDAATRALDAGEVPPTETIETALAAMEIAGEAPPPGTARRIARLRVKVGARIEGLRLARARIEALGRPDTGFAGYGKRPTGAPALERRR